MVREIVSGGQTGADRGALDAAIELGLEHGGW
ncbi:MAG: putative molybdenum carrier protein, partial [Deltaproteobacteria bacterium]|nr:putative molybdenum carrier protein [Kofleriaceae bacterium]